MIATLLLLAVVTETPAPTATPELPVPTPAATAARTAVPPAGPTTPAARVFFAKHVTQWPAELTLSWTQGLAKRTLNSALNAPHGRQGGENAITAAGEYSPVRGMAIAGDLVVDSTKTLLASAGGQGCGAYTQQSVGTPCSTFPADVIYLTQTWFVSIRAKPYLSFGPFRVFAAAGLGYGNIDTIYSRDQTVTDQTYGKSSRTIMAPSAQIGGEWAYKLAPNGACFIIEGALTAGAPRYDETIQNLFYPGRTWRGSNVGYGLNPLRATVGIGFSFPTSHPPGG